MKNNIQGAYYLHMNRSIIYKPGSVFFNTSPEEYFDSDLVVAYWLMPNYPPSIDVSECKKFLADIIVQMIQFNGKKSDIQRIANEDFKIPLKVFNAIYRSAMDNRIDN